MVRKMNKAERLNKIQCDICGYYNNKDYVKYSGVCHLCGKILDDKAYFKQTLSKKMRLWRGKKYRTWGK